jgi:antitoxin YefM
MRSATATPLWSSRQDARSVVMVSQDEYESMTETLNLMKSPRNAVRLIQAMEDVKAGRVTERELMEIKDDDTEAATLMDAVDLA